MTDFVPGLELAEALYKDAVAPILADAFPGLGYGAALVGPGSDVLGFDTAMSMDHDWGPRLQLFLREEDLALAPAIDGLLRERLPPTVRGFPVNFASHPGGEGLMQLSPEGRPVNHRVAVTTVREYVLRYLGFDLVDELSAADWLSFPSQKLRSLARAGAVFRDGAGLGEMRDRFARYPPGVASYLLASSWSRIGEDEHLMGRAGYLGDELGARLIAGRLVRELMRLCFLLESQYAPYAKWYGTAFARLACGPALTPLLDDLLEARDWQVRDAAYAVAVERVAAMHQDAGLCLDVPAVPSQFHERPFRVIWGERFAESLLASVEDPAIVALAKRRLIGGIDQFSDSTALHEDVSRRAGIRALYR